MTPTDPGWGRRWPAPAKINLFLHVLGRRDDGYHDLQTAFQFLDLCDDIVIDRCDNSDIERPVGLLGIEAGEDLVVIAAQRLKEATGYPGGARISVTKRIPHGGGLGGGSSDAATVLTALNHLWGTGLGPAELAVIGLGIGSDVPVFIHGQAAWAEGRGERLSPMDFETPFFVVVRPECEVATGRIFGAPELTRNSAPITISGFLSTGGRNDCLAVVSRLYPEVREALEWLSDQQVTMETGQGEARLTGTGSCVFAGFGDAQEARAVLERLPGNMSGFIARGINVSPLLEMTGRAAGGEN